MTAQSENSSMIDMYNKTQAVITGTVSRINNTGYGKSITLKECEIKTEYGNSYENVIVYVNNDEVFIKEGFVIEVSGSIRKFEKARNEGMFDAYTYYKSNGIAYRCEAGKIVVTGQKNSIEYIMPEIKNKINNIYEKITDNETKGFLNAVILGDKSEIDDEMYELYRNNGIAHILAISGLHITFLASFVYNMLRKRGLAFFPAFGICALFLVFYSIMTGNSVSAKRAVIMYMVKMGAEFAGRTYDTLSSLAFAMIIICAENVNIIYNPGFLLSFTAIAGIAIFCPAVVKSMKKIMILISVIFLMCTGIWFRFHTKECRVVSDLAYDKNKKGDHLVYIREGHELVPFLVLTSDYNGETLLLRKEVLKMNMQINSYEAYYENSFMDDYLNHEYIRQLPDGMPVLESEIKITDEKSLGVSGTGTKSIKRKIFLLAYSEVMEDQNINAASEGTFLRFFEKEEQRIVLKENQKSSWWLRTPNTYYTSCVYVIGANNKIGFSNAYDKNGVRPAFCVPGDCKMETDQDGHRVLQQRQ